MRNLKRALSLALASVMLLGMMVVGTSAASYPDVDDNDNVEAIEVLNAIKVMVGKQGKFDPDDAVNRHEMAVIMAKLYLGVDAADNYVGSHPFTDVVPWADKYVAACYENGLVAGTSATTYGGGQQLTAIQAAAMMLRALGYKDLSKDAKDWRTPVAAMANQIRLFSGVASNPKAELDRNQVAQLTLNTLKSPMVDLKDNTLNISGGTGEGAFVITGGSRDYVVRSSSEKYAQAINNTEWQSSSVSGVGGYTVELGEHLFNGDLRLYDNRSDDFGRPAMEWRYKSESIGTYTKEADLSYTKGVKVGAIYKDLALNRSIDASRVTVYVDGKLESAAGGNDKRNEIKSGDDDNGYGANGVLTQVWFDDKTNTNPNDDEIIITEVQTYVAKVNTVNKASGSTPRSITLDAKTKPGTLNTKFETELFEVKDLVTYTAAWNGSKYDIVTVAPLAQSATGVLTKWVGKGVQTSSKGTSESSFTVDSTKYEYSKNSYTVKDDGTPATIWSDFTVNKSSVNVYLDKYDYAIYIEGVEGEKNWAAVIGVGQTNPYGSQTQGVTLLLPDGTQKTVTAKMASGYAWTDLTGVTAINPWTANNLVTDGIADLVSYIDDDGTYELTILGGKTGPGLYNGTNYTGVISAGNSRVDFKNGRSALTLKGLDNTTTNLFTTSNTIFLVCTDNGSNKAYNAYTGYENMPSIDTKSGGGVRGIAYKLNSAYTNQVDIVYIDAANLAGTSVNTFFVKEKGHKIETDSDLGSIYRVNAIVNGEKQELLIRSTIPAVDNNSTKFGVFAIDNVITNSKGVITGFEDVTATTFDLNTGAVTNSTTADQGTIEANGTVIGFGKTGAISLNPEYAAYDAASKVYYVDKDFKDINEIGVAGVSDDNNDYVWAARDNTVPASWKKLKTMIIVEVPDTVPVTPPTPVTPGAPSEGMGGYEVYSDAVGTALDMRKVLDEHDVVRVRGTGDTFGTPVYIPAGKTLIIEDSASLSSLTMQEGATLVCDGTLTLTAATGVGKDRTIKAQNLNFSAGNNIGFDGDVNVYGTLTIADTKTLTIAKESTTTVGKLATPSTSNTVDVYGTMTIGTKTVSETDNGRIIDKWTFNVYSDSSLHVYVPVKNTTTVNVGDSTDAKNNGRVEITAKMEGKFEDKNVISATVTETPKQKIDKIAGEIVLNTASVVETATFKPTKITVNDVTGGTGTGAEITLTEGIKTSGTGANVNVTIKDENNSVVPDTTEQTTIVVGKTDATIDNESGNADLPTTGTTVDKTAYEANATVTDAQDKVTEVNGTLAEIVTKAKNAKSTSIKLNKDATLTATLTLAGKVTLDLNGNTITGKLDGSLVKIESKADVTINGAGGAIKNTETANTNKTLNEHAIEAAGGSTLTVNNTTIEGNAGVCFGYTDTVKEGTTEKTNVTLKNCSIKTTSRDNDCAAITSNGYDTVGGTLVVDGCTVTGKDGKVEGMYLPGAHNVTVKNGTTVEGTTAISIKAGTLKVTDTCKLTATAETYKAPNPSSLATNGSDVSGAVIGIFDQTPPYATMSKVEVDSTVTLTVTAKDAPDILTTVKANSTGGQQTPPTVTVGGKAMESKDTRPESGVWYKVIKAGTTTESGKTE